MKNYLFQDLKYRYSEKYLKLGPIVALFIVVITKKNTQKIETHSVQYTHVEIKAYHENIPP